MPESAVNSSSSNNGSGSVVERDVSIMDLGDSNAGDIDEDLHSRQLAVYGRETMRRLFASNVLILGIQGLGAEIAKNLILAGVKSVTLHDEGTIELWDLSSNFIFTEDDVGKNRALAYVQKLQELNNAVIVHTLTTPLAKEQLSNFQGEPSFHLFGFLIVFAATAARAIKSVLQGILLSSEGISNRTLNAGRRSQRNDLSSLAC